MKYKKQFAALTLSLLLLAGTALPSFAENNNQTTTDATTSDSTQTTSNATVSDDSTSSTDATDADTSNSDSAANTTDSDHTEATANQTSSQAEDGTIQMPTITIDAKASLLVNAETGEIIHADNEKEKEYPASCTKIMTALLALENCSLDNVVTMQEEDFTDVNNGASNAGLKVGEKITVENLLYCLMLPSGNEAANALARVTAGSIDEFVQKMNDRAKELGCVNSHFVNPNGLHNDDHYTCAYDLYLIAKQAMQNSTFAAIVNTAQKKLPATNMNEERIVYTTNELILSSYSSVYCDNCYGIKTGHTSQAGYCLVSYATQSGYSYYSVVLGANAGTDYAGSFTETKRMFEWAFDNFRMETATQGGDAVTEAPVRLGRGTDHVTLVTSDNVSVLVPKGLDISELDVSISVDDSYDAPIEKGEKLGTVTYSYNGMKCATADLIALSEVNRSTILFVLDEISKFFQIAAVRIILLFIVLIFIFYLILSFVAGRNRRNRKKAKKRKNGQKRR